MSIYDHSNWFLEEGFNANLSVLRLLQFRCRMDVKQAAQACCVSPRTYWRWLKEKPNPTAVKLMSILAGYVPWEGWEGWQVHKGYLIPPEYIKGGVRPGDIYATIYLHQLVGEQDRKIQKLEAEIASLIKYHNNQAVGGKYGDM
jgi:transcriptional regulator with XRE-family HTH domain